LRRIRGLSEKQPPGRRRAHDRRTDDATSIIGGDIELDQEYDDAIHTTEKALMTDKCRTNYHNRMNEMIQWVERKYPQYWTEGTRELTALERADKRLHHHNNKRDFVYAGLNVRLIKGFLSEKKVKTRDEDGNVLVYNGFSHVRKYDDAIKWGAKIAGENLSSEYFNQMDTFIRAFKKEHTAGKSEGKTEERDADPITCVLFHFICEWARDI